MRALLAQFGHYVVRFFGYLRSKGLSPREQARVRTSLTGPEAALFFDMQDQDQRHSLEMAKRVEAALPGDALALKAALLHDVGKGHHRLGAVRRSIATIAGHLRIPAGRVMRAYWDHPAIGASDLAAAGSAPFVVEFTARHTEPVAEEGDRWKALVEADRRATS